MRRVCDEGKIVVQTANMSEKGMLNLLVLCEVDEEFV